MCVYMYFIDSCTILFLGEIHIYDGIVMLEADIGECSNSQRKEKLLEMSEQKEFELCLRAFVPNFDDFHYNASSGSTEKILLSTSNIIGDLHMRKYLVNNEELKRFMKVSFEDTAEVM